MFEAATSDLKVADAREALPQGGRAARPLLVHDQHGPPLPGGPRGARAALPAARGGDRLGGPAYRERKRAAQRVPTTTTCCSRGSASSTRRRDGRAARRLLRPRPRGRVPGHQPLQGDIVDGMAKVRRNVAVVGDDAQAIYSFRGASFENILGIPGALPRREVFRLDAELSLDARDPGARQRLDREQRAAVSQGPAGRRAGGRVPGGRRRSPTSPEQARFVAQRILEWHDEGRRSPTSRCSTAPTTRRWSCRSS